MPTAVTTDAVEVALLDTTGVVVSVNDAWTRFGLANGATPDSVGLGTSYLAVCDAAGDDPHARQVGAAIRRALGGELPTPVHVRFPCDAPAQSRWFELLVSSRFDDEARCVGATVTLSPTLPPRTHRSTPVGREGIPRPALQERLSRLTSPPPPVPGLEALLEAHATVLRARTASLVARQLVRVSSDLVRADHGTLGVLGPDATFTRFLDDGQAADGDGGTGGEVLAVPVPTDGGLYGILYLTCTRAAGFSEADERQVTGLALAAGRAIDNARMHEDAERRRAWQAVSTVAVQQLFRADDRLELDTVLRLAMRGAEADFATLVSLTAEEEVIVEANAGTMEDAWLVARPLAESLVAAVLSNGTPVVVDLARHALPPGGERPGIRSVMAAPLVRGGGRVVALVAGRRTGRDPFDRIDLEHLTAYAGFAGSALDVDRARYDRENLMLLEEHERIAADLHGQVVQELFSTGMGLQGLVPEVASREVQRRLLEYVDALDATIHRIRSTVFAQRERRRDVTD